MFIIKSKKGIILLIILLIFNINIKITYANEENIIVSGESVLLIDEVTDRVIYEKNSKAKMFPASTTKILTALIAVEYLNMDDLYVIGREINTIPWDSSKAGHKVGESILGINLVRSLIILSGNDSACVVASIVAKKVTNNPDLTYERCEAIFAELMNKKAKEYGCTSSNFVNPHGYHNEMHYTNAEDMAKITKVALKNDVIKKVVREVVIEGNGAGEKNNLDLKTQDYRWASHNALINSKTFGYQYATGVKTGNTNEAGYCLVASAEKDNKKLILVIFSSDDKNRWIDSKNLFEYCFNNFEYKTLAEEDYIIQDLKIHNPRLGENEFINLYPQNSYLGFFNKEEIEKLEEIIVFDTDKIFNSEEDNSISLITPAHKNESIGKINYKINDKDVFSTNIIIKEDLEKRTFKSDVNFFIKLIKENAFTSKAIPFWVGFGFLFVLFVMIIISMFKKSNQRKNTFYMSKRHRF